MTTKQLRSLNNIAWHYGEKHQTEKAIEECNELITELEQSIDGVCILENIIDEIADVEVMINQLKIIFDCYGEETEFSITNILWL